MPKTSVKVEDFEIVQTIGTGSFGTCRKVIRRCDGKAFVWKEIDYGEMMEKEKQLLVQEVNLLRELKHRHIVRYYDRIIERSESKLYIIMEYCEGGDLATLINSRKASGQALDEEFVWKVLHQLLQALEECHKKRVGVHKVVHRDLKPANVFLTASNDVKLGDFGIARILHHNFSLAKTFVGTPYYMSPEQFNEDAYNEKTDLWSLGCLAYELCALSPPFTAPNQRVLSVKVRGGRFKRIPSLYSSGLQAVIASLLNTDPEQRPEIPALLQIMSDHIGYSPGAPPLASAPSLPPSPPPKAELDLLRQREERIRESEERLRLWEKALQEKERHLRSLEMKLQRKQSCAQQLSRSPLRALNFR